MTLEIQEDIYLDCKNYRQTKVLLERSLGFSNIENIMPEVR